MAHGIPRCSIARHRPGMKILFRVAYHTVPGQSLWLKLAIVHESDGHRMESWFPMTWLNHEQWQIDLELSASGTIRLEYHYQLRQENNGLQLDEWNSPRVCEFDSSSMAGLLLNDTWCSAGTIDHVLATGGFATPHTSSLPPSLSANHLFTLFMVAMPEGTVPCLSGGADSLGAWDPAKAVPMSASTPHTWQASIDLPADDSTEYKYGLWDVHQGRLIAYEEGANRQLAPHPIAEPQMTMVHDEGYRRPPQDLPRAAGVAIPVFSLRSEDGLGTGEFADLKAFGDWAARAGFSLIQILPVNDTTACHDWRDSYPYSAISTFALHPIYLRLEEISVSLTKTELRDLSEARESLNPLPQIDHPSVMRVKMELLHRIFRRNVRLLMDREDVRDFLAENRHWLRSYSAFCLLRDRSGTADHSQWENSQASPEIIARLEEEDPSGFFFHQWLQFELDRQLRDAVRHLHQLGIRLKGDLPIGIDRRSADAWAMPHLFHMDRQAGAPPDAFAEKGQNWGFPTYHWENMAADGFSWWKSRFTHLSRYFDAFRIDHILGFFRIWQIPCDQIDGIMGSFEPSLPVSIGEIRARGIPFEIPRFCRPGLREPILRELLGDAFEEVRRDYLEPNGRGGWRLQEHVATQRDIDVHFARQIHDSESASLRSSRIRQVLMDLAANVLFFEVPDSKGTLFHPRCQLHETHAFQDLDPDTQRLLKQLHDDYFYQRHNDFWQTKGYEKLPAMRRASSMLLCGEDLGMVPDCVPGVMRELGILSLEIQRMPKSAHESYAHPAHSPYLSVVSTSTHDMSPIRAWWEENPRATSMFARECLGIDFPPHELTGELARRIIHQHLISPAMWAIFPLQDLLALDESLRHPDPDAERINIPAITPFFWRYRMHLGIDKLLAADDLSSSLKRLIEGSGRITSDNRMPIGPA